MTIKCFVYGKRFSVQLGGEEGVLHLTQFVTAPMAPAQLAVADPGQMQAVPDLHVRFWELTVN